MPYTRFQYRIVSHSDNVTAVFFKITHFKNAVFRNRNGGFSSLQNSCYTILRNDCIKICFQNTSYNVRNEEMLFTQTWNHFCVYRAWRRRRLRAFTFTVTHCASPLPQEVFSGCSVDLTRPSPRVYIRAFQPFVLRRSLYGAPALCATSHSRWGTSEKCVARARRRRETPTLTNQVCYCLFSGTI